MSETTRYIIDPKLERKIIKYYADRKHLIEQMYDINDSRNMRRALQNTLNILDMEHYNSYNYNSVDTKAGVTYLREYLSKRDEILRNILYKRSPTHEPLSIEALEQYWNEKIHTLDHEYNTTIEYRTL